MNRRIYSKIKRLHKIQSCRVVTSLIPDYISGELNPDAGDEFEKHLKDCTDCLAFVNTYKKTIELTKTYLEEE